VGVTGLEPGTSTVTGLTNGTTYTFTVSASHTSGSSDSVSPPATPSGQAGTIDSPLPVTGSREDGNSQLALWALTLGIAVIVIARRRQRI
jgi:chitodextrinase